MGRCDVDGQQEYEWSGPDELLAAWVVQKQATARQHSSDEVDISKQPLRHVNSGLHNI